MQESSPSGQDLNSHSCFPLSTSISETEKTHPLISHSYAPHPQNTRHTRVSSCLSYLQPLRLANLGVLTAARDSSCSAALRDQRCFWGSFQGLSTKPGTSWTTGHSWIHGTIHARHSAGRPCWHTDRMNGEDVETVAAGREMCKAKHWRQSVTS